MSGADKPGPFRALVRNSGPQCAFLRGSIGLALGDDGSRVGERTKLCTAGILHYDALSGHIDPAGGHPTGCNRNSGAGDGAFGVSETGVPDTAVEHADTAAAAAASAQTSRYLFATNTSWHVTAHFR